MKLYRNSLKRAAGEAGVSLRLADSGVGEWCYPVPYHVADWAGAERIAERLGEQGWVVEQRTHQTLMLAIDDHYLQIGEQDGQVSLTLHTRKPIVSAPAH